MLFSQSCLYFSLLISCGLISVSLSDVSLNAGTTVQKIEGLYNEVLKSSINNSRAVLPHLNDSNAIDNQFFTELDKPLCLISQQRTNYWLLYFQLRKFLFSIFSQKSE
ncbi:uncharacterized protein LOC117563390 [Drosophila albomicans]|uniref:Uncharacterized protein LOC117563390 n=1 Tax=Drosophila albomicans TaxID=7291 RepID=A0A9C6T1Y7_DROAB|nr:uncharacterized protein LOC117563390 [Drosophila albomicans]